MERLPPLLGIAVILLTATILSEDKRKIDWKTVAMGVGIQFVLAILILKTPLAGPLFNLVHNFFTALLSYSDKGASMVFGTLADRDKFAFIFFITISTNIIFVSALISILYYLKIMEKIMIFISWPIVKLMRISGAEAISAMANIFMGLTEAPLLVRPFIAKMTRSELLTLMTAGMATIAVGVLVAYVGMGIDGGHLLRASILSALAGVIIAKIMIPEKDTPVTRGSLKISVPHVGNNLIDAISRGARDGLKMSLMIFAMLVAFVALVAMANGALGLVGSWMGFPSLTLELILGHLFAPFAWMLGIPWEECKEVGLLLGKKTILNEFVAYLDFKEQLNTLSPKSVIITTYALCSFANIGSVGILTGVLGEMAPNRLSQITSLGWKSLVGGTMACSMSTCVVALLL